MTTPTPTPITSREDALAVIVEQRSNEVIQAAVTQSVALRALRRVNMGTKTFKMPILDTLPRAEWLSADDSKKPTTRIDYAMVEMTAEEIAAIAVIPENVLDDSAINLWADVRARVAEAIGAAIDAAVFFGDGAPPSFPAGGLVGRARATGHEYAPGADEDLAEQMNQAMALVEADGYNPRQAFSSRVLRPQLRGLRDGGGSPLYVTSIRDGVAEDSLYGVPIDYVVNGTWDAAESTMLVGDPSLAIIGVRQDITAKMLDQATVGNINLAEQDCLALRVKARFAFLVTAPRGLGQSDTPFPFATVTPAA